MFEVWEPRGVNCIRVEVSVRCQEERLSSIDCMFIQLSKAFCRYGVCTRIVDCWHYPSKSEKLFCNLIGHLGLAFTIVLLLHAREWTFPLPELGKFIGAMQAPGK